MDPTNAAQAIANFTDFAALAHSPNHFRELNALLKVTANNCEFWGSSMGGYWEYYYLTNNLFDRVYLGIVGGNDALMTLRNCTMRGGSVSLNWGETWPIRIENCSFDGTDLSGIEDSSGGDTNILYCDHNAIITNLTTLPATGGHDVVVTTFNWQSSWFGNYYLPTNSPLINAGSTTADHVGLYHFTTQTNQVPETNSIVDIGYHYVATDAYGNPLDSNGNGIPDYVEDCAGTGTPFSITLLTPTNNAYYVEPANIPLLATVSDWRNTVVNVTFFRSQIPVNTLTNAPYNYTWPVVSAGAYTIKAIGQDNGGIMATSTMVNVTITNLCGY